MAIWEGVRGGSSKDDSEGLEEDEEEEEEEEDLQFVREVYATAIAAVNPAARRMAPGYEILLRGLIVIF